MKNWKRVLVPISLVFLFIILINYSYFNSKLEGFLSDYEKANVTRVIDGDTIEISGGEKVRLLGIDTPEKGEIYHRQAKQFLENRIEGKEIFLEFGNEKRGKYGRILAYVVYDGKNLNKKLIEEGFTNHYFPSGKDVYYSEFVKAWNRCVINEKRLCEKSSEYCSKCISLKEMSPKNQEIILQNSCKSICDIQGWKIHDEGGKDLTFPELALKPEETLSIKVGKNPSEKTDKTILWNEHNYVWTRTGDTFFLRDDLGKLVLWESY